MDKKTTTLNENNSLFYLDFFPDTFKRCHDIFIMKNLCKHSGLANSSDMDPFVIPNLGEASACDSL